jgi:hypothetical protein
MMGGRRHPKALLHAAAIDNWPFGPNLMYKGWRNTVMPVGNATPGIRGSSETSPISELRAHEFLTHTSSLVPFPNIKRIVDTDMLCTVRRPTMNCAAHRCKHMCCMVV